MAEPTPLPLTASRVDQIFPVLSSIQMQRLVAHGDARSVRAGEVLVEPGAREAPIFVVVSGELEAVRPSFSQETLIRVFGRCECIARVVGRNSCIRFALVRYPR